MPLAADQQVEYDLYQKEVERQSPADILQFSANYFNKRLEQQRYFTKQQESFASSRGIDLFSKPSRHESVVAASSSFGAKGVEDKDVQFKLPFVDQDPHAPRDEHITSPASMGMSGGNALKEEDSTSVSGIGSGSGTGSGASSGADLGSGLFKGNFNVGKEASGRVKSPLDPHSGKHSSDRKNIVNHQPLPLRFNAERRTSVSGETFQPDNLDDWTPEHYSEKTQEQLTRLAKSIGKNFLFSKLDPDSKTLVINSLEEKNIKAGTQIIRQGDEGDYFYVVEEGTVEFFVDNKKISSSGPGSSFGELALMYNHPRVATVMASTDCILWALDRITFRKILLGSSFKKRLMYDELLKIIPILTSLTTYDRAKLADALDTEYYEPGQVIIKQGDRGENFYLIEYGECDVSKAGEGIVAHLKAHDYFGEVALLNDLPRQATVTARTKTKVATLGKSGFQRLLGPVVDVLKLNDPTKKSHESTK
ncbi:hypothetical protein HG535_0F03370 [Zygotorulaspora mrakii]|uniref:cAMP-dependent protein kinase regulatory subunit n=1 Tax=Zygotorulaspora mrakii TaxID=42260 RepID=A0A7H9B688_ZYGMR|nr:uncharacterized protein HG535_0F03370 [Zygotorulaspora mrakii]QLG73826.1 hypothetical protein HG535_0F03370 [Zygotorulaspora mrakii]